MKSVEVAVIGAGPAGLSASIEVAKAGAEVVLIDENNRPGGQLFKQIHKFFGSRAHMAGVRGIDIATQLLEECEKFGVKTLLNTVAFGLFEKNKIGLVNNDKSFFWQAKKIVLATGASENVLNFPGWTLPGVMGAGALQTMMNVNRVLPGKRILMIGSGNVGLIVSYQALQAGAEVVAIVEAAPQIGGYGVHASKIRRVGVPILISHTVQQVFGSDCVERAVIIRLDEKWKPILGSEKKLKVDVVCLSVGLTPLTELAWMVGCKFVYIPALGGHIPIHNWNMESSKKDLYIAGDLTGVEEASTALEEGRLAGLAIAESLGYLKGEKIFKRKAEVRKRLAALRSGPFGETKRKLKESFMQGDEWKENE
ncbi:pyridine nucleotide-disulfide oxidoreductase [Candidatus Atribacteria bacterium HGW-Atribacteria-1]|nr:MAG: pyridine nucleotide-disulfide oxidoreductase [Candidatus Atribacteria bacterium HGW-Atribacteria-1]